MLNVCVELCLSIVNFLSVPGIVLIVIVLLEFCFYGKGKYNLFIPMPH